MKFCALQNHLINLVPSRKNHEFTCKLYKKRNQAMKAPHQMWPRKLSREAYVYIYIEPL